MQLISAMKKYVFHIALLALIISSISEAVQIYRTGNPTNIHTRTQSVFCAGGGAGDDDWSEGWRFLLKNSGGGDIVIIRADGVRGRYENWIYNDIEKNHFPKVNSVTTIVLESERDGNNIDVIKEILNAEMIFFAGGDQSLYLDWIAKTKLAKALNYQITNKKIPFAGTSAGATLFGSLVFSSRYPSPQGTGRFVTAEDVLSNPLAPFVDLDKSILSDGIIKNTLIETHFSSRQRQGRLLGFLANALKNRQANLQDIKGIGIDDATALCYNSKGQARVFGAGYVYFVKPKFRPLVILQNVPLTWMSAEKAFYVHKLNARDNVFNLNRWTSISGDVEHWWVDQGLFQSF